MKLAYFLLPRVCLWSYSSGIYKNEVNTARAIPKAKCAAMVTKIPDGFWGSLASMEGPSTEPRRPTHTNMAKPTPFRKRKSNPVSLI